MRDDVKNFHNSTLQYFNAMMYEQLIYPHNITTESAKSYTFEDEHNEELPALRGYFAMKDVDGKKTKYFLEEKNYKDLPFKVIDTEEIFFKDSSRARSVVLRPLSIKPFRIYPDKVYETGKEFIDIIAPFSHSEPNYWTLNKIIAVMGYVGKTFCGVCSSPEFGKSSVYIILDIITKKSPVFQPRSVPGILAQITSDGNMVFDDIHAVPADVRKMMENFTFKVADNSPTYINGAVKSMTTKPKYDIAQQSITFLYNTLENYKDENQFWDNLWEGKAALKSRFLCLQFKGKLLEKFDKDFDIPKVAEDNKMFYLGLAKHLLYLKELKLNNAYQRRFKTISSLDLQGRHRAIYDEITWGIDYYCTTKDEYDAFIRLLDISIIDYQDMIGCPMKSTPWIKPTAKQEPVIQEEAVLSDKERVLEYLGNTSKEIVNVLSDLKVSETLLNKMKSEGDIFEQTPGKLMRL